VSQVVYQWVFVRVALGGLCRSILALAVDDKVPPYVLMEKALDTILRLRRACSRSSVGISGWSTSLQITQKDDRKILDALIRKTDKRPEKLMEAHIERSRKALWEYYRFSFSKSVSPKSRCRITGQIPLPGLPGLLQS
jgi:hypothetical protein